MPNSARTLWRRIRLLARQPIWWAEASVAASLTIWALICIHSPHGLNHYHSFNLLLSVASETTWERLALAAGAFHVVALVVNGKGAWLDGHHWRIAACLCSAWFLTFLLINLLSLTPVPPGSAFYIVPLGMDLVALYKNATRTG
jgi:hypothetical protein